MSLLRLAIPPLAATAVALVAVPVGAEQGHRREQDAAFAARRAGQALSVQEIEQRIVPRMPGSDYLGPEYDSGSSSYRLKFMRAGSLIWIDVDARTGQIIGRSGN